MLIPASRRAEIADAVTAKREAERDERVMKTAQYAIPRARELFEQGIEEVAASGGRKLERVLGVNGFHGCVMLALEEKYGDKYGGNWPGLWDWSMGLRGFSNDKKRWRFVHEMWVDMVESFISDLRNNGYRVDGNPTPKSLVDSCLKVSW